MWKDKIRAASLFLVKHSKIAFPVIVVAAVAATVTLALNAGDGIEQQIATESVNTEQEASEESSTEVVEPADENVPLVVNEDGSIYTLIATYYNAVATGDADTLNNICDEISEKDMLRYQETAKYIQMYPTLEIYTKPGLEEGSTIAYVYYKVLFENKTEELPGYQAHYICTNDQGSLYIKRGENSEEVNQYIKKVSAQDDVVEFNNRITVEYNELMAAQPELLEYLSQLDSQVSTAVGEILAQQAVEAEQAENNAGEQSAEGAGEGQSNAENGEQATEGDTTTENGEQTTEQQPVENVIQYAEATTTVNVRSSDSEQADKLGKVAGGEKVEVLEQRVNGWTKIVFDGKEGYIKSEFLRLAESAAGAEVIGTVTASTNINVRSAASESAERLGVLAGGDSAELIANENDWCKIKYNGQIGYVKAEYVQ